MTIITLEKRHFPLIPESEALVDIYCDGSSKDGCPISRWLHENGWGGVMCVGPCGGISYIDENIDDYIHRCDEYYGSDVFKRLNEEFRDGRTEPFTLTYPTFINN